MIDPKAITSFAQYNEDIILAALLHDVDKGFYIDVGANYPVIDSVTKYFYDRGWHGINIEPVKGLYADLKTARPRDINIHCGLGETEGTATLREFQDRPGHSTFDSQQKQQHQEKSTDYAVPIKTLEQVFQDNKLSKVNFIKIDVEGYEYEVVSGNDWEKYRPEIICIEANHMVKDWTKILLSNKYKLFIKDGLNEYYVAQEAWERTEGFAERAISLDYHRLKQHQAQSWEEDSQELTRLHDIVQRTTDALEAQIKNVEQIQNLSLKDQRYLARVKRALIGLSVDWVRYKKTAKK